MPYAGIERPKYYGAIACALLKLDTLPTEGECVVIGDDWYEFRSNTPPTNGSSLNIWVYRGGTAAAARANLIKAINGTVDPAIVDRSTWTNSANVVAVAVETRVCIKLAGSIGGTPVVGKASDNYDVSSELTGVGDGWNVTRLLAGGGANEITNLRTSIIQTQVTQAMIDQTYTKFFFPFNVLNVLIVKSTGAAPTNAITPALPGRSGEVTLSFVGGDLIDEDYIDIIAFGTTEVIV